MLAVNHSTNKLINKQILTSRQNVLYPGGIGASRLIADPYMGGFSFFFFLEVPAALMNLLQKNSIFPGSTFTFFDLLQYTFNSFSGINDMDLSTDSITGGWTSNEVAVAKEISKGTYEVSMGHQELSGSVYGEYYKRWVTAIANPQMGYSSFATSRDSKVTGLFFNVSKGIGTEDDDDRASTLERAFIFTDMFPTKVFLGHHNQSKASHDLVEFDMPFKADMFIGENIDNLARAIVKSKKFYTNFIKNPANAIPSLISTGGSGVVTAEKYQAKTRLQTLFDVQDSDLDFLTNMKTYDGSDANAGAIQ